MKTIVAFLIDFIVLGGLVFGMIAITGDSYTNGGILTRVVLMACVGGIYGLLRAIYRKWLFPEEDNK